MQVSSYTVIHYSLREVNKHIAFSIIRTTRTKQSNKRVRARVYALIDVEYKKYLPLRYVYMCDFLKNFYYIIVYFIILIIIIQGHTVLLYYFYYIRIISCYVITVYLIHLMLQFCNELQ